MDYEKLITELMKPGVMAGQFGSARIRDPDDIRSLFTIDENGIVNQKKASTVRCNGTMPHVQFESLTEYNLEIKDLPPSWESYIPRRTGILKIYAQRIEKMEKMELKSSNAKFHTGMTKISPNLTGKFDDLHFDVIDGIGGVPELVVDDLSITAYPGPSNSISCRHWAKINNSISVDGGDGMNDKFKLHHLLNLAWCHTHYECSIYIEHYSKVVDILNSSQDIYECASRLIELNLSEDEVSL